ncbi:Heterokaryon incompatibility protein 6, OR allele [Colletotrichum tropicale]|nr:Heterokaryon incompatibility protein 6, OR allele [Colletotrichum tropicale]
MAKFTHTPITTDRSIRILTLHPGTLNDRLRGDLEIVNIDISTRDYETISYVWGSSSKTHDMVCNGAEMFITESLHGALTCMRLAYVSRRLWVDQVCIDQDNAEEKNSQIPLMDVIYRSAGHVLVWLGHDQNELAGAAFSLITNLAATFADEKKRMKFDQTHSDSLLWGSRPETEDKWSPLRALAGLPWQDIFRFAVMAQEEREKAGTVETLGNACVAVAWQDGQPYDSVPARRWLAHGANYLTCAVQAGGVSKNLQDLAEGGDKAKWARAANNAARNRAFAKTHNGYYVLGPKLMEPGDVDEGERLKNPLADEEDDDADSDDDDDDGHHGFGAAGAVTDAWGASGRGPLGIILLPAITALVFN